jgi:hypothetical protein
MHCEVAGPDIGSASVCLQEIGGCGVLGILTSSRKNVNLVLAKVAELVKRECSTSGSMTSGVFLQARQGRGILIWKLQRWGQQRWCSLLAELPRPET